MLAPRSGRPLCLPAHRTRLLRETVRSHSPAALWRVPCTGTSAPRGWKRPVPLPPEVEENTWWVVDPACLGGMNGWPQHNHPGTRQGFPGDLAWPAGATLPGFGGLWGEASWDRARRSSDSQNWSQPLHLHREAHGERAGVIGKRARNKPHPNICHSVTHSLTHLSRNRTTLHSPKQPPTHSSHHASTGSSIRPSFQSSIHPQSL